MAYTDYQYLYPPRPEKKIPVDGLGYYENRGWYAQAKKNGTNTVIFARGLEVIFKTRHGSEADHRAWAPLPEHFRFFQSSNLKWNVYCAELLHSKTPHIKHQLYIYDQIVKNGEHLTETTFAERQQLLHSAWPSTADLGDQVRVDPYITVAKSFDRDFRGLFKKLKTVEQGGADEGLVLKNPAGKLRSCITADSNCGWQVKCRIPHKNYSF